jgi:hypothetical protein
MMHLDVYIGLEHTSQEELAEAFAAVGEHHKDEPDVLVTCMYLAGQCRRHADELSRFVGKYGESDSETEALHHALFQGPRSGGVGLLRDLQDLYILATMCDVTWQVIKQASLGLRDEGLSELCTEALADVTGQKRWLLTRIKTAAPQALLVAA